MVNEFTQNINDEDIDDNFVGAFPSNHMNKFIDHPSMISQKKEKYPFVVANTDSSSESEMHWWSVLDIEPKTDISFFDSFGADALKILLSRMIRNLSKKFYLELIKWKELMIK